MSVGPGSARGGVLVDVCWTGGGLVGVASLEKSPNLPCSQKPSIAITMHVQAGQGQEDGVDVDKSVKRGDDRMVSPPVYLRYVLSPLIDRP